MKMKMKMKAGLIVVVAIAAVMMLSSYAGAQSPDEITESVRINSTEVKTYKYDMNMTIDTLTSNETNVTEMTIKVNAGGEMDIINESMWMRMHINVNPSEDMGENANMGAGELPSLDMPEPMMEMYLINNITYMKVDLGIPFMPALWIKMKPPVVDETYNKAYNESYLSFQDQLELLMTLLNSSNVTLLDDEVVDSTDCYVLKLELDFKKLLEFLMNQTTMGVAIPGFDNQTLGNNSQEMEIGNVSDGMGNSINIMNMSMTEWIAKDTYFMMKTEATLDMTTTTLDTGEEATTAIVFNQRYYDYNVPVTIELPAEAENAIDLGKPIEIWP